MGEIPPTGGVLDRTYAVRIEIVGDRIAEFRIFCDRITVLSDLGLPLVPAAATD